MLKNWLRGVYKPGEKNSKPRIWRTLIEALRDKVTNEEAMADKLEKEKYPDTNQGTRKGTFHTRCDSFSTVSSSLKA